MLGLDSHLALKHFDAKLILLQCRRSAALTHVEAHQRAMGNFLERIQTQQLQRRVDRRLRRLALHLHPEKAREHVHRQFVQTNAFRAQPRFEVVRIDREALKEFSLVQRGRPGQRICSAKSGGLLELHRIDLEEPRIESDTVTVDDQRSRNRGMEGLLQDEEGLSKTVSRLIPWPIFPEQGCEGFARCSRPSADGKIRR